MYKNMERHCSGKHEGKINMNTLKKRLISLALLCCFALASVTGCSSKDSSSKSEESDHISANDGDAANATENTDPTDKEINIESFTNSDGYIIVPFQSDNIRNSQVSNGNNMDILGSDPDSIDVSPQLPQTATESVTVVNEDGEPVTEEGGQPVTEYVTVPDATSGGTSISDYKSLTDGRYIVWVDISKDENYVFNDKFIKVTMKIKENIPDGDYPISIVTELSSIKGALITPDKILPGTIRVGSGEIDNQDVSSESGFVVYGDNVSCKQGDTIDYYISMKNNPGLAAVLIWFYYDSNAIEIESVVSEGEFKAFARPQTGDSNQ